MDIKLYSRLDVLADHTLSIVLERNRLRGLNSNVDKHAATIEKNIAQLREGIQVLSEQQSAQEQTGARDTKTGEDKLIQLQTKVDKLASDTSDQLLGTNDSIAIEMDEMENGQILQLQQRMIEDQDQDLDHLSEAIRRQRELGILIGQELETHAQIIDETEEMVDRTDERLSQTRKRLNYLNRKLSDNKSTCIVIALIIVFFVLVVLFR